MDKVCVTGQTPACIANICRFEEERAVVGAHDRLDEITAGPGAGPGERARQARPRVEGAIALSYNQGSRKKAHVMIPLVSAVTER